MTGSQAAGKEEGEFQLFHGQVPPAAYRYHPAALWLKPPRYRDEKARVKGQKRGINKEGVEGTE